MPEWVNSTINFENLTCCPNLRLVGRILTCGKKIFQHQFIHVSRGVIMPKWCVHIMINFSMKDLHQSANFLSHQSSALVASVRRIRWGAVDSTAHGITMYKLTTHCWAGHKPLPQGVIYINGLRNVRNAKMSNCVIMNNFKESQFWFLEMSEILSICIRMHT